MVLSSRRSAAIALIAILHATAAVAQRSPTSDLKRSGEMRPMLYGFALECIDCAPGERGRGSAGAPDKSPGYFIDGKRIWFFRRFPRVLTVVPGSAAEQAGIQKGDVLQSIDGLSLLTNAGAQRLAQAVAGDQVHLGFLRDSQPVAVSLVLGSISGQQPGTGPIHIGTGYVALQTGDGKMKMEIWSDDPIISQTVASDSTIVLRIGTNTIIKIRPR